MKDIHPTSRVDNNGNALLGAGETHVDVSQLRDRGVRRDCCREGKLVDIVRHSSERGNTP